MANRLVGRGPRLKVIDDQPRVGPVVLFLGRTILPQRPLEHRHEVAAVGSDVHAFVALVIAPASGLDFDGLNVGSEARELLCFEARQEGVRRRQESEHPPVRREMENRGAIFIRKIKGAIGMQAQAFRIDGKLAVAHWHRRESLQRVFVGIEAGRQVAFEI